MQEAVNSIGWVQLLVSFPPVSESLIVSVVMEGLQQQPAKPKLWKEPMSSDMLTALVENLGGGPALTDVCIMAACLVALLHMTSWQR